MEAYQARPPYQRNDYLGWIDRAKRPETKARRCSKCWTNWSRGTCT